MPCSRYWTSSHRRICCQAFPRSFSTTDRLGADVVRIVEVGPRDGLQNEKTPLKLNTKIELITRLSGTGLRNIEAGSFVSPKWVPQMANSAEVLNHLLDHPPVAPAPTAYNFLTPNLKGFQNLLAMMENKNTSKISSSGIDAPLTSPDSPRRERGETGEQAPITSTQDPNEMPSSTSGASENGRSRAQGPKSIEISLFTAATETFSKANTNCTIAESLERFKPIISLAKSRDIRVRGYVSVALGCPYEGPDVPSSNVANVAASLLEMGVDEVSVADTTGMGTAPKTQELLKTLFAAGISAHDLALHFHDTYGQALVNAVVGLEQGIRTFDSSVGGLGGCPFSKGATGNIATEDLLHCIHSLGAKTDVDVEQIAQIGAWISNEIGKPNDSRAGKAILARLSS
ncbi:hypothetical protein ACLMJK_005270 [Lecanora helva]